MTNHIHLIAVPVAETSLAKAVGGTHLRYARYVNRLHGRSGHLWQNRFFSCPLEERHYLAALRYVERNPVRASMVRVPWRYPWSSAAAHCAGKDPTGLLDMKTWRVWTRPGRWREFLRSADDGDFADRMRKQTFDPPTADSAATASSQSWKPSSIAAFAPAPAAARRRRRGRAPVAAGDEISNCPAF